MITCDFPPQVFHRRALAFLMTHIGTFKIDISTVYRQPGTGAAHNAFVSPKVRSIVSMSRPLCCSRPQVLPEVGSSHRPGRHPVRGEGLRQGQPERSDEGRSSANAQSATSLLVCRRRGHRKVSRVHRFAQTIRIIHK